MSSINDELLNIDSVITDYMSRESTTAEEAAEALFQVYNLKASISYIYDMACSMLDKAMNDMPEIDLGAGVRIEKKVASDRRSWKHSDLASELARRIIMTNIDMDTGESQKTTEELITELLRFVQPSYWRVKELASIGVNADNYCEVLEPKTSIIVRKPKS